MVILILYTDFAKKGPCISDMTLRVNDSMMPVIRQPNFSDKTWDVKMKDIPIVIGNETANGKEKLQTISLSDYLTNFSDFMTNTGYKGIGKTINLLNSKENGDSHVIMSSQACFLPIIKAEKTKFNVALYNYQSKARSPTVLVIVSTAKGASAQIIEGRTQYLLFNNNGKNADFVGERVSDVRRKRGQKNLYDKKLSKREKQENVIVIVQVPIKRRITREERERIRRQEEERKRREQERKRREKERRRREEERRRRKEEERRRILEERRRNEEERRDPAGTYVKRKMEKWKQQQEPLRRGAEQQIAAIKERLSKMQNRGDDEQKNDEEEGVNPEEMERVKREQEESIRAETRRLHVCLC